MTVPLWEWAVSRDTRGGSAGVSMTHHGAMEALARALIQAGRPTFGHIVPVTLTRPMHEDPYYLRGIVKHTAIHDGEVIRWR